MLKVPPKADLAPSGSFIQVLAWGLAGLVSLLAIIAWGVNYEWDVWPINAYNLFPLLGLLAFSLMWCHYVSGALREILGLPPGVLRPYFRSTSYVVLVLLCLHPGLLIYQLFRDGAGLPPGSYMSYVAPGLSWVTLLGTVSLLVFLAFEFYRKYGDRPWFRYVRDASDLAMLAIVYHGFRLGGDLQQGWYHYVWWFYAITLSLVLIRKYAKRWGFTS